MPTRIFRLDTISAFQILKLFRFGSAILISILLAKSSLGTSGIAHYEYLLYIGTAVSFFWVNALLEALLAQYPGYSPIEQQSLIFNVFLLVSGISMLIFLLMTFGKSWIIPVLTDRPTLPYYQLFCVFLLFNLPTMLIEYIYLLRKQAQWIVNYALLAFGGYAIAILFPIWLGYGLAMSIQCIVGLAAVKLLWLAILALRPRQWQWRPDLLKPYLLLAFPLVLYTFAGGFAQVFDNWLVSWYFKSEELFAIFRYGARELPIATALVGGLYAAIVADTATDLTTALRTLRTKGRRIFHYIFPLAIILMLSSKFWFPIVFNPTFKDSAAIFNVYLLIICSRVLLPSAIMMGLKQTRTMLGISILELLLNILLSFLLVSYFGLAGIALATVIAFLVEKIALIVWLHFRFAIKSSQYVDWNWYGVYSTALVISYLYTLL